MPDRSRREPDWLITCEHGGNRVPRRYADLFRGQARTLASHRGLDPGASYVARVLSRRLEAPLIASRTTRLLVDLNRSPHHPRLFSEFTRALAPEDKARLLARHYWPYRSEVEQAVRRRVERGGLVLHVSAHSFAAELGGKVRRADIGLLYDPRRFQERTLAAAWRSELAEAVPGLRVRRNYPYRGVADGLVTALRRRFAASSYAGIELEVNQRWVDVPRWKALVNGLAASLERAAAAVCRTA